MGQSSNLSAVQYLRGFSAVCIVITHISLLQAILFKKFPAVIPEIFLGWAVDIFFTISGFIIVYITADITRGAQGARQYALRRVARVVPAYWVYSIICFFLMMIVHHVFIRIQQSSIMELVRSLLFIEVAKFPVLVVGWTINYEMFFYLVFGASLLLFAHPFRVYVVIGVFAGLFMLGLLMPHANPYWSFLTNSLLLEIDAGMVVGLIFLSGYRASLLLCTGLLLLAAIWLGAMSYLFDPAGLLKLRAIYYGIPAAMILAGLLWLDVVPEQQWLVRLGDVSYSIYLSHGMVAVAVAVIAKLLFMHFINPNILLVLLTLPLTLVIAFASYRVIEMKLRDLVVRKFGND